MRQFASKRSVAAVLGLVAVGLFLGALTVCALVTPDFDLLNDFISKLGANGQPYAVWWNSIGFLAVGAILAAFGYALGNVIDDATTGICLVLSGVGFALGAIPTDMSNAGATLSKVHFVSICLALAGWCLGVARIGSLPSVNRSVRRKAEIASVLVVIPIAGYCGGLITKPIAHRLLLGVVLGWVAVTSLGLLSRRTITSA